MRKVFLFCFLLFLSSFKSYSQGVYSPDTVLNKKNHEGKKIGAWKKYYSNGGLKYEGTFLNDKPIGVFKRYYPDGSPLAVSLYEKNGSIFIRSYFKGSKKKQFEGRYTSENVRHGEWKAYHSNGKMRALEQYKNGKYNGVSQYFYSSGIKGDVVTYKNGVLDGKRAVFYKNGKHFKTMFYKNGSATGEIFANDRNGRPLYRGNYKGGLKHGKWKMFKEGKEWVTLDFDSGISKQEQTLEVHLHSKDSILESYNIISLPDLLDLRQLLDDLNPADSLIFSKNTNYLATKDFSGITFLNTNTIDFLPRKVTIFRENIRITNGEEVAYFFDEKKRIEKLLFSFAEENNIPYTTLLKFGYAHEQERKGLSGHERRY